MPPARQPWPMKWIVLAILVFVALYTYLNLRYRKPGPEYEPYQDSRERAGLAEAGYSRITVALDRPADPKPIADRAPTQGEAGGLPADLRASFLSPEILATEIGPVEAAPVLDAGETYRIQFSCTQADNRREIIGAHLFLKGGRIFAVPDCAPLAEGLVARTRAAVVRISVPPRMLPAGAYRVILVGERNARSWALQVH
jgi:hypothetical protein